MSGICMKGLKCCYYRLVGFKSYSNHYALLFMFRGTGVKRQIEDVLVRTELGN